jgi:hypothetical protein
MKRDRVHPDEVRTLLERARDRAEAAFVPPPHIIAQTSGRQGWCA